MEAFTDGATFQRGGPESHLFSLAGSLLVPDRVYRSRISPYFWINGKRPISDEWKALVRDGFAGYRLKVYGLVENPVELSLEDIHAMGKRLRSRYIIAFKGGQA